MTHWPQRFISVLVGVLFVFSFSPAIVLARDIKLGSILEGVQGIVKSQEAASMSEADEIAVGKEIAAQTLGAYPIAKEPKLQRYVNQTGLWIALQSSRPDLPWRFAIVKSDQINAFAVPGGAILITSGMFNFLANEAELACVIGHEIGHVVRRHHLALLQKNILTQTGAKILSDNAGGNAAARQLVTSQGAELFTRSLDRSSEQDADRDGVALAANAGYDPGACLDFMQRMADNKQSAGSLEALYKTHPQASDRVVDVKQAIDQVLAGSPATGLRPPLKNRR